MQIKLSDVAMIRACSLGIVFPLTWSGIPCLMLLVATLIVLLLFGGKKIPELMKGLGKGVKEFKDASKSEDAEPAKKMEEEKSNS